MKSKSKEINRVLGGKPSDAGMRVNLWDGKILSAWIEKTYGIELRVRQCRRVFRQSAFRLLKPRPVLARADPAREKEHKKTPKDRERRGTRSLGSGRGAFSAARVALRMWCRQKTKIQLSTITPRAKAWGTSAPCGCGMASYCIGERPGNSMGRASGTFSKYFSKPASWPDGAFWSSATTPNTIVPGCIWSGGFGGWLATMRQTQKLESLGVLAPITPTRRMLKISSDDRSSTVFSKPRFWELIPHKHIKHSSRLLKKGSARNPTSFPFLFQKPPGASHDGPT